MNLKKIAILMLAAVMAFGTADARGHRHGRKHHKARTHNTVGRRHHRKSRPQKSSKELCNFEEARIEADSVRKAELMNHKFDIPFSTNFTNSEVMWVKVKTPGMFGGNHKICVDLTDLSDSTKWHMPLPGCHIISPFGGRRKHHSGDDIKTKPNDKLYAVFDGVVRLSRSIGGYGKVLVIRHPNGLETVYSHNSRNFVSSGDTVRAGDVVALTGRTGRATTEHCHFELRINGLAVNPTIMFDFAGGTIKKGVYVATPAGTLKRSDSYNGKMIAAFSKSVVDDNSDNEDNVDAGNDVASKSVESASDDSATVNDDSQDTNVKAGKHSSYRGHHVRGRKHSSARRKQVSRRRHRRR